ncbi:very short patch repair endonuclease [soil metagenome]
MANVRNSGTKPEMRLRRALWAAGLRYRVRSKLPGKPDVIFLSQRLAVFVDGCFWHECLLHATYPKTNEEFWRTKLRSNVDRDRRVDEELSQAGWRVLRFWEHDVKDDLSRVVEVIGTALA